MRGLTVAIGERSVQASNLLLDIVVVLLAVLHALMTSLLALRLEQFLELRRTFQITTPYLATFVPTCLHMRIHERLARRSGCQADNHH